MKHKDRHLFKSDEWEWFLKLGSLKDPEEKKAFYDTVMEKKRVSSRYSLFDDFPKDNKQECLKICGEILEMLKHGKRNSA